MGGGEDDHQGSGIKVGRERGEREEEKMSCRGDRASPVISPLHDGAAASLLLGGVGVLALVDLDIELADCARAPRWWNGRIPVPIQMGP